MSEIFYDDDILDEYEKQEEWEKSVEYLCELMSNQPLNKSILYRFAAQNWYVLTFWYCCMPNERMDRTLFELGLKKAYIIATEKWWNCSDCLWLFGYFMCINPIDCLCLSDMSNDIIELEKEGNNLIEKAYCIDSKNQLAEMLYLCDNGSMRKYKKAKQKYKENIGQYFPRQSQIEQYFSKIFTDD